MFKRFRANYYPLPKVWFDLWADLRQETGRARILAPLKTMEYIIKWTWGQENFDRPVRIPRRTFRYGWRADGERLDRGTKLSTHGLEQALRFLTTHGLLVESWAEGADGPSFLPRLRPDSDPSVAHPQPDVSRTGFRPPETNTFPVPIIWTDVTHDVSSEALILATEYFFRHTWGWQGDDDARWMDIDEIANGRRYRSPERRGERRDRGIRYSERRLRSALREGLRRGWLVRRCTEWGRHQYALHIARVSVAADDSALHRILSAARTTVRQSLDRTRGTR